MSPGMQSIADLTIKTRPTSGEIPPPLVGASTLIVKDHLYVFGGRHTPSREMSNDLYVLDLSSLVWKKHNPSAPQPRARYFHSATVHKHYMVIFGGMSYISGTQDLCALDDVLLLNLNTLNWVYPDIAPSVYAPEARYAHLAVTNQNKLIVMGGQDMANQYIKEINVLDLQSFTWVHGCSLDGQYDGPSASPSTASPNTAPTDDVPVCVYSNYNFAEVVRDLHTFHPLRPGAVNGDRKDHSGDMSGAALPPGLRFPSAHLLGHHMILTGTYLTPSHRSFQIWALNLANLVWMRIDTGAIFASGSWNRGILGEENQTFYVLGNRDRQLLDDYNRRQLNFDHLATVNMEAFGIYTYPAQTCVPIAQELGLSMLNEPSMADIELITSDGKSIPANASILARRWPFFSKLRDNNPSNSRTLTIPESYAVSLAFLQYIYTDHLMTAQQHQPHILTRLLLLADMYKMPRLVQLATHALHQILTISTASMVYETAALTCRTALQIRALRVMINAKKMLQQQQQQHQQQQMGDNRRSHELQRTDSDGSSSTLRRLAASKSSTTASPSEPQYPIMPKMSKSGTLVSGREDPFDYTMNSRSRADYRQIRLHPILAHFSLRSLIYTNEHCIHCL
ncbi:hypothetical protein BCR43DRAFT_382024 [Syncephalastrum racemosum]|uniref:BTB domain-containing protein n=1 Tax=Syncephalastrum racemosum TaxID=13706 RepID=A0A1X2H6J0_SYNRA|nr:hypothetical protein BCR43DRAFT_382024 [Syncephalastrum racemosum]